MDVVAVVYLIAADTLSLSLFFGGWFAIVVARVDVLSPMSRWPPFVDALPLSGA